MSGVGIVRLLPRNPKERDADTRQRALHAVAAGRKAVDVARELGIGLERWRAADGVMLEPLFDWDEHDRLANEVAAASPCKHRCEHERDSTSPSTRATPSIETVVRDGQEVWGKKARRMLRKRAAAAREWKRRAAAAREAVMASSRDNEAGGDDRAAHDASAKRGHV